MISVASTTTAAQMAIVTNMANVSKASAPPTSVDGAVVGDVVPQDHRQHAGRAGGGGGDAARTAPAATAASARRRRAAAAPPPTRTSSGDSANQSTSGPANGRLGRAWHAHHVVRLVARPATSTAARPGISYAGALLDVADQRVDARLDAVEQRLRVDADEHDQPDERQQHEALLQRRARANVAVVVVGLAVEHPLVGPQQVQRGEDHAGRGDDGPPPGGEERADQDRGTRRRTR